MNKVKLLGKIVGICTNQWNTIVTLLVRGRKNNYPKILFGGSQRVALKRFKEEDYVRITAVVKTRASKDDNHRLYRQFLRATNIVPVIIMGGHVGELNEHVHDVNTVELVGNVAKFRAGDNYASVLLALDGYKFKVWVSTYVEELEGLESICRPDAKIHIIGEIQTKRKMFMGKTRIYEDIIAHTIVPHSECL